MDKGALLDSSPHAVLVVDRQGIVRYANHAAAAVLGHRAGNEMVGMALLDALHPADRMPAERLLQANAAPADEPEYLRLSGDPERWMAARSAATPESALVQLAIADVTEGRRAEQQLLQTTTHDVLTELPGRALLLERLGAALDRRGKGDAPVAVLFVDLDGFKLVNAALGHATGDAVLVETAARLRSVVSPGDMVGRLGADEFLLIRDEVPDAAAAAELASRIDRELSRPFRHGVDELFLTASVGVALSAPGSRGVRELVSEADEAMFRAKRRGKHRFQIFDEAMRERASERARIAALLRRALPEDRVVVHYQPVVDLRSRSTVAVEALMRIRDDDGSLLLPDSFLDIAEESGLLPELDTAVLFQSTRQVQSWIREIGRPLDLAVNVSAGQIDNELDRKVEFALADSGLAREHLVLEMTEQTLIDRGAETSATIHGLHRRGTRWAIDDFGTGWASLTYLRRFPASFVKVDRSFVAGLPRETEDMVIVQTLVDMARRLSRQCIAEGVETEEQYQALCSIDPPLAQGWLFGRPAPAEEFLQLL